MAFLAPRCPIEADERAWIDESMTWFVDRFGRAALFRRTILPTPEFFPGAYAGSEADVRAAVTRVCGYLDMDPGRVEVEVLGAGEEERLHRALPYLRHEHTGEAGHYRRVDGKGQIAIDGGQAGNPMALVATIAHELCHELLHGAGLVEPSRKDGEPLTDLLTVYLGLGIFSANAAFSFTQYATADLRNGWRRSRQGYLTEPMYGYGLAWYALMRGEPDPAWARYLDTNPRTYLRRSLRYLRSH